MGPIMGEIHANHLHSFCLAFHSYVNLPEGKAPKCNDTGYFLKPEPYVLKTLKGFKAILESILKAHVLNQTTDAFAVHSKKRCNSTEIIRSIGLVGKI